MNVSELIAHLQRMESNDEVRIRVGDEFVEIDDVDFGCIYSSDADQDFDRYGVVITTES